MKIYNSGKKILLKKIHPYLKQISNGGIVLDLGCGTGDLVRYLANRYQRLNFIAADIHRPTLNYAKQFKQKNVSYINNTEDKIPLNNNSVDFLYCTEVIEHVEDDKAFIKELRRVLKKNSFTVITTPNLDKVPFENTNPDHKRHYPVKKLTELFGSEKFNIINVDYRWPKISRKIDSFINRMKEKKFHPKNFQPCVTAIDKKRKSNLKFKIFLLLFDTICNPFISLITLIDYKINASKEKYNIILTCQKN